MPSPLIDRALNPPAHRTLRISRWLVIISVPLLLMATLVISMQKWPVALAAFPDVFVGCSGPDQTPNSATIQEAVNAATPGTVINICPGTYAESVNLSLMATMGDITLRQAPGTEDFVEILPAIGAGIFITPNETFTGNITIEDVIVATSDSGIDFGTAVNLPRQVEGKVLLHNVLATENSSYGAYIRASGAVTVESSEFSDNFFSGLVIRILDATVFDLVVAAQLPNVYVDDVIANLNGDNGIDIETLGTIEIFETEANENGQLGPIGFSGGMGIRIENWGTFSCADQAQANGFPFVHIESVSANGNLGSWGINVDSENDIGIFNIEASGNAYDGIYVYTSHICFFTFVQVSHSYAYSNGWGGEYFINLADQADQVEIQQEASPFGGFRLFSDGDMVIDDETVAEENAGFGYCFEGNGEVIVHDSLAVNNAGDGFSYGIDCEVFLPESLGRAESVEADDEETGEASGEAPGEISVEGCCLMIDESLIISNSSAISNGSVGFEVLDAHILVTMTNISALRNITGVAFNDTRFFEEYFPFGASDVTIQGGEEPIGGPTLIFDSLIQSNTNYGVVYGQEIFSYSDPGIQGTLAQTSTNFIHSSIVCENGEGLGAHQFETPLYPVAGVGIQGLNGLHHLLYVDARGNWWGHPSGPSGIGSGQGDSIVIAVYEPPTNTVDVDFDPWISLLNASAIPSPTLAGIPVALEYSFSDAALQYFLENGVGDPTELWGGPLFRLSATNGTINDVPAEKFIVNNFITGSATPTAPGVMTVQLDGPCGLSPTLNILVAQPGIDVEKTPDLQGVGENQSAVFTVTVANTGNITLTDITVEDTVAPICARAEGVLGNIGVGASSNYTCTLIVSTNVENSVEATGSALINGDGAGDPVVDADTAQVVIAGLTLSKTVFVEGFNEQIGGGEFNPSDCALASNITVPVGTVVKYCYTISNTGDYTLSTHSLIDSHLGTLLTNFPAEIGPGGTFSSLEAGEFVTATLTVSTTNVATWTAEIAVPVLDVGEVDVAQVTLPVVANATATVTISAPGQDQDGDTVPDNDEGSADTDSNGIPDFLDPAGPTNEPPTQQPGIENLFLPSLDNS